MSYSEQLNTTNGAITFLLNDLELAGTLNLDAEVLEGSASTNITGDIVVEHDIALTELQKIFKFQTDSISINDVASTDLLFMQDFNNNASFFQAIISAETNGANSEPANILIEQEYVQWIAYKVFGTRHATDIISNENNLITEVAGQVSNAFTAFLGANDVQQSAPYNETTTTVDKVTQKLMQTIMRLDARRLNSSNAIAADLPVVMQDSDQFQPVPLAVGDKLVMKFTLTDNSSHCTELTSNTWVPAGATRAYVIVLNVV